MEPKVNYLLVGLFVVVLGAASLAVVLWLSKGDYRGVYDRYYTYMRESVSGLSVSSCPNITFTAGGTTIKADKSTAFQPSCNALKNGDNVRVKGKAQADSSVLASKIERK